MLLGGIMNVWRTCGNCESPPLVTLSFHVSQLGRYHGGWLAPNIYYLGAAGSIYINPTASSPSRAIRLSGLSGIYKSFDYRRGHFESVPFNEKSVKSAYHVREYDVLKLKQVSYYSDSCRLCVLIVWQLSRRKSKDVTDLFMSHDWPVTITRYGDEARLLQQKPFFRDEVRPSPSTSARQGLTISASFG